MFYSQVPYIPGHGHFTNDHIDSFPDLHVHDTFEDRERNIRDSLRKQL